MFNETETQPMNKHAQYALRCLLRAWLEFEQNLLIESIDVKFNDENFVCNGNKFSDIVKKRILKAKKGDIIIVRVNYTGKIPTQNEALVHTFE